MKFRHSKYFNRYFKFFERNLRLKILKTWLQFLAILLSLTLLVFGGWHLFNQNKGQSQSTAKTSNSVKNTAAVSSKTKKIKTQQLKLVALGDSLTQGVGDTTNQGGYVGLIQQKLTALPHLKVQTLNYGKAGDRSDQILQRLQASQTIQQQVKQANVIVMTVGGNDLMQVFEKQFSNLTDSQLAAAVASSRKIYQNKVNQLLQQVRAYNSTAPIFVYSVYNPFYVYFPKIQQFQKYTELWNTTTKQAVAEIKNAYFVNIDQRMSTGQYYKNTKQLQQTSVTDITTLNETKLNQVFSDKEEKNHYLSSADHFHPNLKGYRYMTSRLYQVMLQHEKTWHKS